MMVPSYAPLAPSSVSYDDPRAGAVVDMRKRKRMMSNRESARRSRMRKQRRLDDLATEAGRLMEENRRIMASLKAAEEGCMRVENENSVLRAQMDELAQRLKSLDDLIELLVGSPPCSFGSNRGSGGTTSMDTNEWCLNQGMPINASSWICLQ